MFLKTLLFLASVKGRGVGPGLITGYMRRCTQKPCAATGERRRGLGCELLAEVAIWASSVFRRTEPLALTLALALVFEGLQLPTLFDDHPAEHTVYPPVYDWLLSGVLYTEWRSVLTSA